MMDKGMSDDRDVDYEVTVAGEYVSQWGEGPIWWEGALYYVDIENGVVVRYDPLTGEEGSRDIKEAMGRVGTVVPKKSGGFLVAGDKGIGTLDWETGAVDIHGDPEPELTANRFNDGKCSPDGHFFAGTISLVKKEGSAKLYRFSKEGEIMDAYGPVTNSNGIIWSGDGSVAYYIDTPKKEVLAFDYKEGELSHPRQVVDTSDEESSPDGMTIDGNGRLWVAFCHGACVKCYDPESGECLETVVLPCLETTAVAFGGDDLEDLYVTTGIHKTEVEELAGRVLCVRGLGTKGVSASAYDG